jgi:hypothetical protein
MQPKAKYRKLDSNFRSLATMKFSSNRNSWSELIGIIALIHKKMPDTIQKEGSFNRLVLEVLLNKSEKYTIHNITNPRFDKAYAVEFCLSFENDINAIMLKTKKGRMIPRQIFRFNAGDNNESMKKLKNVK